MFNFFRKKTPPETLIPQEYLELLCTLASSTLPYQGDLVEVGVYNKPVKFEERRAKSSDKYGLIVTKLD